MLTDHNAAGLPPPAVRRAIHLLLLHRGSGFRDSEVPRGHSPSLFSFRKADEDLPTVPDGPLLGIYRHQDLLRTCGDSLDAVQLEGVLFCQHRVPRQRLWIEHSPLALHRLLQAESSKKNHPRRTEHRLLCR